MKLPPKSPLNSDHRFSEMELEHKRRFLGLSHRFAALLMGIVGIMSLFVHDSKKKFNYLLKQGNKKYGLIILNFIL
jgi:hypothetical protein